MKSHPDNERGGSLIELALVIPIFVVILALIFDAGLGFSAARDTSSAARGAARVAALAGDDRLADFRAIEAVRSEYMTSDDDIVWIAVYRSPAGGDGAVPAACLPGSAGAAGLCNVYDQTMVESLTQSSFSDPDCAGDPDQMWCPTDRAADAGDYLGVAIWAEHEPTVGILVPSGQGESVYEIDDRAVFALYFPN